MSVQIFKLKICFIFIDRLQYAYAFCISPYWVLDFYYTIPSIHKTHPPFSFYNISVRQKDVNWKSKFMYT